MKKKLMIALAVIGAAIAMLLLVKHNMDVKTEYSVEMADLQGMYTAEMTARMAWKGKLPEKPVEYWYNANEFALIPAEEKKPEPCGMGKTLRGGAVKDFEAETGKSYIYDENEDYRDKIIHVVVGSSGEELDITVEWISAK